MIYTPYFKTKHGRVLNGDPIDILDAALSKYEEWAKDYFITSAWIEERDPERPWYFRKRKVKLVGVLKKEVET